MELGCNGGNLFCDIDEELCVGVLGFIYFVMEKECESENEN